MLEALERRDVPAIVLGPSSFANPNFINPETQAQYVSATISLNEATREVTATFSLNVAALPSAGYTAQVGLVLYSTGDPYSLPNQIRMSNTVSPTVLSASQTTATITVKLPPGSGKGCIQCDAYVIRQGDTFSAPLILDVNTNAELNNRLVAYLVDCTPNQGPSQGLTRGYYKNHLGAFELLGLSRTTTIQDLFGGFVDFGPNSPYHELADDTLIEALDYKGGSSLVDKARIMLAQAVTAYLNACSSSINYSLTAFEIVGKVSIALNLQDPSLITALGSELDGYNNAGGVDLNLPNTTRK